MTKSILLGLLGLTTLTSAAPVSLNRRGSGKRGLAYNNGALTDYFGGSKVTWTYNWVSASNGASSGLEFVPMLHSTDAAFTGVWAADVKTAVKAGSTHVLSFNEPDQCGGGGTCITDPGAAASAHKQYMSPIADTYPSVKIGAPAVTNGVTSSTGSSMGLPYLKSFLTACDDCRIDFVAAHWYDSAENVSYFKQHLQDVHTQTGKPVWVTEFAPQGSDAQKQAFLQEVLPWMDGQDWIERYAYQWVAPGVLINDAGTGLSALGSVYQSA
ncbi:glycoside hydrolase family 128 protein [Lophiostoma macrostomum CBS 122681]|uniref:Glycoside hydrolase family 128 protein n=1 Tax=Lophiostoma macrostomum CBS 122681 TaxID=1314788 RepID=A0A6A6SWZ7_9PLEO|nr:glycoside hydrolase family 128 protein [Lophiostoma macrostomum CBS 122681]